MSNSAYCIVASVLSIKKKKNLKLKCKNSNIYSSMKKYTCVVEIVETTAAGLDFSKWNLSFSCGRLDDCSFLWQSFCDVKNHMLYTKLNLKCELSVSKAL